ncbi:MAG: hypothetical protein COB90_00820 [Hyphomicrobiales bacterium]|nr:MAG: hypothetical protein COB90_00820 [Hyphomicrobiales bacterium]
MRHGQHTQPGRTFNKLHTLEYSIRYRCGNCATKGLNEIGEWQKCWGIFVPSILFDIKPGGYLGQFFVIYINS